MYQSWKNLAFSALWTYELALRRTCRFHWCQESLGMYMSTLHFTKLCIVTPVCSPSTFLDEVVASQSVDLACQCHLIWRKASNQMWSLSLNANPVEWPSPAPTLFSFASEFSSFVVLYNPVCDNYKYIRP
jgi:hypothetical protein